jgi:23S rRNA (guanosine2251-2'-O)-methyltransferase
MTDQDHVWGIHAVLTALEQSPERVDAVWIDAQRGDKRVQTIIDVARSADIKVHRVPRPKLDQLAGYERHQGVVARVRQEPVRRLDDLSTVLSGLTHDPFLLVLDGVQDPHNLGACLRSADGAGVDAVIIPKDQSVGLTPTVRHVACGAAETIPVFQVTNLSRTLTELKERGVWVIGAAGESERELYEADMRGPLALVLGGEEKGLRRLTRERCDLLVRIPMQGTVSSLNVSVAAGVCLYEAVRQRRSLASLHKPTA